LEFGSLAFQSFSEGVNPERRDGLLGSQEAKRDAPLTVDRLPRLFLPAIR
jgi:hypothetical protein